MDLPASVVAIAPVVMPVFLIPGLGFFWTRAKLPYDSSFITAFSVNVSTPCLVFAALMGVAIESNQLLVMALASFCCIVAAAILALPVLLILRQPLRVYLPALSFPNSGNLGLPVCLFAFGESGLGLALLFHTVIAIAQFTIGPAVAAGHWELRRVIRTPLIHAVALALMLRALGIAMPQWLLNTASQLGACAVPLMLFSLGVALSGLKMHRMVRSMTLSAFRLVLGIGAGACVTHLLGLTGQARGVVIVQSFMPVAVFNYLWALRYGNAPDEVAGMVLGSTALSLMLLPVLLSALL